jgi:predicted O-methyltransferase YrrM
MDSHGVADWLGYLSHGEIEELKRLAQSLPGNPVVVNIGAGGGTSGLTFLEARPDLTLYTVDIQDDSSPLGCLEGERNAVTSSGVAWQGRFFQICGDSKQVGREWKRGPVDMVFIDGDHSYEGCAGDIVNWLPHVKAGGILALHDYKKPEADKPHPGVDQSVGDLLVGRYVQESYVETMIAFRV